jgi:hypothetical protein
VILASNGSISTTMVYPREMTGVRDDEGVDRGILMNPELTTIADLICLDIKPEDKKRRKGKVRTLSSPLDLPASAKPARKYECEVFKYLLENKVALGIKTVFRFENLRVDGAILLADGKTRLAVEIKYRMNWTKACQAGYEFRRFL